jgi:hypothetical protein
MPTPDTEALAARLRAVERALTDDETTLDEAAGERPPEEPLDGTRHATAENTPAETALPDGERGPSVRTPSAGPLSLGWRPPSRRSEPPSTRTGVTPRSGESRPPTPAHRRR